MLEKITITKVTAQDVVALQTISRATFAQTFDAHNSPEDMQNYLNTSFAIDKLTTELNNPESEFYFAIEGDTVIGYLKVNTGNAQTEKKDPNAFEIERIYVDQTYLGKKIGQLLFNKAIDLAVERKSNYVWLGVWEENHRAIQFYLKNGFITFDKHVFMLGEEVQNDFMMKLELKSVE
jgi:ribosomal protein S18 acetylase RimI-like enzyme